MKNILFESIIEGGWNWSHVLKKGTSVTFTDIDGGANLSALFYNANNLTERYNMGDTLKCQHISSICKGNCIYSDMGRILLSVIGDSCGWHDVICGVTNRALMQQKFENKTYQLNQNDFSRNGYDSLLVELAKHGLGRRDFTETVNFFSKVQVDEDGNLHFKENFSQPGDSVELRAEMDTLVVADTGMHPLNPVEFYPRKPVKVTVRECPQPLADDTCRLSCEENGRGFANTEQYHL